MNFDPAQPHKNVNGVNINLTADEIAAQQVSAAAWNAGAGSRQLKQQIAALEASVTTRMLQEAVSGSALTFPDSSPYAGQTSAQAIASIRTQITTLRGQLT